MTKEHEPTQTPQPEQTAERGVAKAMTEFETMALGRIAMPTANFVEAPAPTENTITEIPENLRPQQ